MRKFSVRKIELERNRRLNSNSFTDYSSMTFISLGGPNEKKLRLQIFTFLLFFSFTNV